MKHTKKIVKKITKQQKQIDDEKVLKEFAKFLKKSTIIMETAIKETREKHPNLLKP